MNTDDSSPVTLTVHSMAPPSLDARQRTVAGRWKMLAVLAVCAAPVIASYFTYFVIRPEGRNNYSDIMAPVVAMPSGLEMKTLGGQTVALESLKGQWLMVVVAPSLCDAQCEQYLLLQRQLRETLGREKDRVDKVWLVIDDGDLRPALAQAMAAAPPVTVLRASAGALSQWLKPAAGQNLQSHMYVIDPMGNWVLRTPVQPDPAKFKRDVERLLRASASWDRPGR